MSTLDTQIRAILTTEQPMPGAADVAERLSCSRAMIYMVAKAAGIKWPSRRRSPGTAFVNTVKERYLGVKLTAQSAGAAGELIVCADLMYRGWHVYRCVSAHAPADLIIWRAETFLRVECRSGRRLYGKLTYAQPNDRIFDVLAIIDTDRSIEYRGPRADLVLNVEPVVHGRPRNPGLPPNGD